MEAALGRLDEARRREIVAEIGGHLEDEARWLMLRGLSEEASMEKAMEALGDPAKVGRELKQVHGGATRRDAWLAALPAVLLGLSITVSLLLRAPLSRLVIGGPTRVRYGPDINTGGMVVGIGVLLLAVLTLVAGSVVSVVRRLPLWGYTWARAAVMAILCALIAVADDSPYLVSPVIDMLIVIVLLLMMGAALGAASWRGPLLGGLAGLSTTMILSLVVVSWASARPLQPLGHRAAGRATGSALWWAAIRLRYRAASTTGGVAGRRRAALPADDVGRRVRRLLAMAAEPRTDRADLDPAGGRRGSIDFRPGGRIRGPNATASGGVGKQLCRA